MPPAPSTMPATGPPGNLARGARQLSHAWPWIRLACLLLAGAALLLLWPQPSSAIIPPGSTMSVACACMPVPYDDGTVVWSGTFAYAFGGYSGSDLSAIYRVDIAAPAVTTDPHTMPSPRRLGTAVWDPRSYPGCPSGCGYMIGGISGAAGDFSQILRFDPTSPPGNLPVVANLPQGRSQVAADFDGTYIYIFGGFSSPNFPTPAMVHSDILRFDPMNPATPVNVGSLPTANGGAVAVWTGSQFLVIGGSATGSTALATVTAFIPPSTVVPNYATLPYGVRSMGGVWDGVDAYIMGGFDGSGYHGNTIRIPGGGGTGVIYNAPGADLPSALSDMGAFIANGCEAWVVGGEAGPATSQFSTEIYRLGAPCAVPPPPPPPPPPTPPPPPPPPVLDASMGYAQGDGCGTNSVQFTDQSQPPGAAVSWFWDLGDGTTVTVQNPTHTYPAAGDYLVSFTAWDAQGFSDTYTILVHVDEPVDCPELVLPGEPPHPMGPPRDGVDGGIAGLDGDGDGVPDRDDNCPYVANAAQSDIDGDAQGDLCDLDRDGDGVLDAADDCVDVPDPRQEDSDLDGAGDACDLDMDDDGIVNVEDNCPLAPNPLQADADGDGLGDACEPVPLGQPAGTTQRRAASRDPEALALEAGTAASRFGMAGAAGLLLACLLFAVVAARRRRREE